MNPQEFLNSSEGVGAMKDEIDRFFNALDLKASSLKSRFVESKIYLRKNGHFQGGFDFAFDGHTFVTQHNIPSRVTTEGSMFSFSIFNLEFDAKGRALDGKGMPLTGFSSADHLTFHTQYAFGIDEKKRPYWVDINAQAGQRFGTHELLDTWIERLMDQALFPGE